MKKANNKRCIAVLSSAALGVLVASALPTTDVHAAVTGYVSQDATDASKIVSFDSGKLLADYQNKLLNKPSSMFDAYMKDTLIAFNDSEKGLVKVDSVIKAYTEALKANQPFNVNSYTESAAGSDLATDVTVGYTIGSDGTLTLADKLVVSSVSAITTTAYKGQATQLGFAINGGTTQADVTALTNAGYTVSYEADSSDVYAATGKVTTGTGFNYKVVISKDGTKVAESALQAVKVVDGTLAKTLTDVSVVNNGVTYKTLVVGENYNVSINKYTTIKGDNKVIATDPIANAIANANLKYASSDSSVAAVSSTGAVIPMGEGTANITVTADNMDTYTLPVTVKAGARIATTATADNSTVSLSSTDSAKSVKVTVVDQYGDPVANSTIYALDVKSGTDTVIKGGSQKTDATGSTSLNLAVNKDTDKAVTGTYTVKLSTDTNVATKAIGQVTVNYAKAGNIASYALRTTSDSKSTDGAIDYAASVEGKEDNSVTLQLVGKDANGVVGKIYTATLKDDGTVSLGDNLTAKLSGDTADVTPAISSGNINLAAIATKTGKVTLTVYNASLPVATYDVTTTDTTKPAIDTTTTNDAALIATSGTPTKIGAFTVADGILGDKATNGYQDGNATTIGLTYVAKDASTTAIGDLGKLDFTAPVKVKEISIGGTDLTADQMAQLVLKAGTNVTTNYASSIALGSVTGAKVSDLVALGNTINLTVESQSGLDNTYTITLTAK